MATSVRIVIPTRGPSASLSALLADLERELQGRPDLPVSIATVSAGGSASANRNLGAADAQEEWLQFIDDDIRLPLGWLDALTRVLADPEAPDLIGGYVGSQKPRNWFSQASEDFVVRHKEYPEGWYLVSAHLAVRRAVFEQLGGFDTVFCAAGAEDWDLCRRAHAAGFRVGVTSDVGGLHDNPTRWRDLAGRARAYGSASVALDQSAGDTEVTSEAPARTIESAPSAPLPVRAVRWLGHEYSSLRGLGRTRVRAVRSTLIYVPWMVTYLRARDTALATMASSGIPVGEEGGSDGAQ